MNILFKYPTLGRPEWFLQTLKKYYSMLSGENQCRFLITLNENDKTMNNNRMKTAMNGFPNLVYKYGRHKTKVVAINADMGGEEFDILFLISDDMIPVIQGFDRNIVEDMRRHFPNMDGALHYPDGFCNKGEDSAITLPIMGKKLFDKIGHIYHPDYKSFFCDNEFADVAYGMGKAVFINRIIVRHDWRGLDHKKTDGVYKRNSAMGRVDEGIYNRRKKAGFPR